MRPISPTLNAGSTGPEVAALQEVLLRLVEEQIIHALPAPDRPTVDELQKVAERVEGDHARATYGDATTQLVRWFQIQNGLGDGLDGVVEKRTAERLNEVLRALGLLDEGDPDPDPGDPGADGFVVRGRVEGAPPGSLVRAFDQDFRGEEALGDSALTDRRYEVRYTADRFAKAEKGTADLRVAVVDPGGRELVSSEIVFNAGPRVEIDLVVPDDLGGDGPSEYERHLAALAPVMDGVSLLDVARGEPARRERDVDFLAADTGIDRRHVAGLVQAFELAAVDRRPPSEAFYGWLRRDLPGEWDALRAVPPTTLRAALVAAVDQNIVPRKLQSRIDAVVGLVPSPDRQGLGDLLTEAAWPADRVGAVLAHVDAIDAVSDDSLRRLVDDGALKAEEARKLGLTVSLHQLTDGAPALVGTMLATEFPAVPGRRVQQASDLAVLEPGDWQTVLKAADVPPPAGLSPEDHARGLALQAAGAFPETAFRQRAAAVPPGLADAARRLPALLKRNPSALTTPFDDLDLTDVPERDRPALRQAHTTVKNLVDDHPGLDLAPVFTTASGNGSGAEAATRLVGSLADVLARNPEVTFLEIDYRPGSLDLAAVDFGDLPAADRDLVVADFRAHQRIHSVTRNPIATRQVHRAGITSASAMALRTPDELATQIGVSAPEAQAYHAMSVGLANQAALDWFRLYEVARDDTTTPVRSIPSRHQFFRQLTGFRQLFDDQPWCACDDCQSVLSPAAYVVDLLHYIDRWILAGSFAAQPAHPLHLEKRRPDLWDLELTCAATKTPVPTLDLVNGVLERYLRDIVPLAGADAVYRHLADQEGSLGLPFTLPLERLRVLLQHFGLTRHDVARALRTSPGVQARAALDLSPREYALVTQARPTDGTYLGGVFGLGTVANTAGPDAVLAPVDLAVLLRVTGLDRDDLVTLLEARFVSRDGTAVAAVDVVMEKGPGAVQNDAERVRNLTVRRLDRLHRFLRLGRKLPWTIAELDYALERLAAPPVGAGLPAVIAAPALGQTKGTLERIADLVDLNAAWDLPVDELFAVVDAVPAVGLGPAGTTSLFDRLFNPAPFVARDGAWPPAATVRFSHPGWARRTGSGGPGGAAPGTASPADNTLTRLLAGLQLSDQDFVELVAGLAALGPAGGGATGLDHQPATATTDESIALSRASIDVLHRHARVRALLGVSTADLLRLLRLGTPTGALRNVDDVAALVALATWQPTSGFTVAELAFLVNGVVPPGAPDPAATVDAVVGAIDPASAALEPDALHVLDVALGDAVERSADEVAELRQLADPLDAAARAAVTRAVQGRGSAADTARLRSLVTATLRLRVLFKNPVFDLRGLTFARQHPAVFFGPTAPPAVTVAAVRNVAAYATLAAAVDAGFSTAEDAVDPDVLDTVLAVGVAGAGAGAGAATDADLAVVLRSDPAHVAALRPHLGTLPSNPFEALDLLARGLELTTRLGVSGETLELMVTESNPGGTYATLARAAEDVYGAFRAKYPSERTFQEKVEPFEDELRGRRRDGLVGYITHRWPVPFADADELYEYFLIDVQVGGCARTTAVVAAMSSLQLYVERVLMNLERSDDWNPAPTPATGVHARFTDAKRRDEWQWRQQFRVWEANRKVFLYPENYIKPELRDDKTPLFTELEDSLLVQRIDRATVGDAYTSYLAGFDELARLKMAGAHYDQNNRTLHLFGVTQDDAPVFYYRSMTERGTPSAPQPPLFSGWQRLSLQIPARRVSPILFEGRLYLFWIETATRPMNTFTGGSSHFGGYRHTVRVKYSMLRLDGEWSAPQLVHMVEADGEADARIVEDPLDEAVINRMRDDLQAKKDKIAGLEEAESNARTKLGEASVAWADALADRDDKKDAFEAPPNFGEGLAILAGLALGIPPEITMAGIRYIEYTLWKVAEVTEQIRNEQRRQAADAVSAAVNALQQMRDQIATLTAAVAAEIVRVRWDRSNRDHKDALDSYRPEGWEWDRVYPDVYHSTSAGRDALRLMLVPRNPPELTTTDPAVVAGPGARPIRSGELDVGTGVLREMSSGEVAT
ncbi:MAG TPA: neuraminidase-like domain-containing protein, partial [Acidimicrobiales bacterium]|nr:neuraminidase-like domain-containing protein [Acidimicrobiales bacterium]